MVIATRYNGRTLCWNRLLKRNDRVFKRKRWGSQMYQMMPSARITAILATLCCCSMLAPGAAAQTYAKRVYGGFDVPLFGAHAPGDSNRLFVGQTWLGRVDILDL